MTSIDCIAIIFAIVIGVVLVEFFVWLIKGDEELFDDKE